MTEPSKLKRRLRTAYRVQPKTESSCVYSTSALARAIVAIQAREVNQLLPFVKRGDLFEPLKELRDYHLQGRFLSVEQIPDWLRSTVPIGSGTRRRQFTSRLALRQSRACWKQFETSNLSS
jgi:hypothetical protein